MFQKTRVQLALFNAAVLFFLLVLGGSALFVYTKHRLYQGIDDDLAKRVAQQQVQIGRGGLKLVVRPPRGVEEAPVATLIWDDRGTLLASLPEGAVPDEFVDAFAERLESEGPQTLEVAGHSFRALTVEPNRPPSFSQSSFAYLQIIRNVDAEQAVLSRLLIGIIAGSLLGAGLAVAAGFVLAGRALVPIRAAWEKQQEFVADASHELRTPLAVVRTHTELLLRHPERTVLESSQQISMILKETRRMSGLVADLLTLARSDSGQIELRMERMQIDRLLAETAEQFEGLVELKEITLTTEIEPDLTLEADEERLRQLFVILLDNAIKYTPEGGRITLSCRRHAHGIEVAVTDTGHGIDPDDQPQIFDRFFRSDKARQRQEGGYGLGLAIAKWIVEAHHGRIKVESQLGQGTTFSISFPQKKTPKG